MFLLCLLLILCPSYCVLSQNVTDSDIVHEEDSAGGNSTGAAGTLSTAVPNKPDNDSDSSQPSESQSASSVLDQGENTIDSLNTSVAELNNTESDMSRTTVPTVHSDLSNTTVSIVHTDISGSPVQATVTVSDDQEVTPSNGTSAEATTAAVNGTEEVNSQTSLSQPNTTVKEPSGRTDIPTTTEGQRFDTAWMTAFLSIHHFDGWYTYNSGKYLFDFVSRFVHPTNSSVLVATFYDEDGAILDMSGTSEDGHIVTFTSSKMYSESFRFQTGIVLQFNGSVTGTGDNSVYSGNITLPQNSSFQLFHMQKGVERRLSADEETSKTAVIIAVVACISFVFILGTGILIFWAIRKGYLQKNYKSYRPFRDSMVTYESDAETVHI